MKMLWRLLLVALFALALWPEFPRYQAEWRLYDANFRVAQALRMSQSAARSSAADADRAALSQVTLAETLAAQAAAALPGDPRAVLTQSIALIMIRRGADAVALLEAAINAGERPEFTINLGRARTTLGDEAGANAAYLRTAWASPQAIVTLPRAMREDLQHQVERLDAQLRAGQLSAPPLRDAAPSPK
ncbi:MAG: hypothetical protein JNN30_12535 [Rhodanobacteraceae bacterium]|nr:hypothetical protein [Rhodanobacteraceae bacterium]